MPNLVNHAAHRRVVHDVNGMSDSAKTESLNDQTVAPVEPDRAPHQCHGDTRCTIVALSSSGHVVTSSLAASLEIEYQEKTDPTAQAQRL